MIACPVWIWNQILAAIINSFSLTCFFHSCSLPVKTLLVLPLSIFFFMSCIRTLNKICLFFFLLLPSWLPTKEQRTVCVYYIYNIYTKWEWISQKNKKNRYLDKISSISSQKLRSMAYDVAKLLLVIFGILMLSKMATFLAHRILGRVRWPL